MQVTPSPALLEAISELTQARKPEPSREAQPAAPAQHAPAVDKGLQKAQHPPYLGRFVDITV